MLLCTVYISCRPIFKLNVQNNCRRTEFKALTAHFQFNPDYPASPLIVELKSKSLDFKLLQGLEKVCLEECQKYLNKQQVQ